ncbi:hypothetical protein BRADI_5g03264v3 [Brachypodium distachyon]|uniref:Uncharacterized protein n=1 Tax=Brachypodium distachyon TaxID=15368 RepID=A0A0Q3GM56_BRADI|nr:hypothetical protein BRADI_5g03264v3 [Brachypodium distachyon]
MLVSDLAWWLGLLLGAVPLLALAVWHCNDAFYRAAFALLRWRNNLPPLPLGHMGIPFLGETAALQVRGRGGHHRSHLFGSSTIIMSLPAGNKFVLQSHDSFGLRWPVPELVGLSSMFNVEGAQHVRIRGFIVAAFSQPRSLRNMARAIQPGIAAALQSWAAKGTIVAAKEIGKVMFHSICELFIGMKPSPLTEKMDEWFVGLLDEMMAVMGLPLDLPGTTLNHARKCRRKLNSVFQEELEKRKKRVTSGRTNEEEDGDEDDLMSRLMQLEDEQGNKLSDEEVLDNMVSLVVGGYESTSSAIMWAVYHLAKSPDVLAKIRMKYTAKVVEETIRLANIAPVLHRVALRDIEYGGYTIPQGWHVVLWLRAMHIDAKYYPDPLAFNPDRWDRMNGRSSRNHQELSNNLVFGGGYRTCAGNMLARMKITMMIHHLSLGYEWELLNPDEGVSYIPQPMPAAGAPMSFRKLSTGT